RRVLFRSSATAPPTLTSQPGEQKQQEQQTQGEHPPARRRWPPGYGRRGRRRDELLVQLLDQFRLRVCCINRCWSWSTALRLVSRGCRLARSREASFCQFCCRARNWAAQASRRAVLVVLSVSRCSPWANSSSGLLGGVAASGSCTGSSARSLWPARAVIR